MRILRILPLLLTLAIIWLLNHPIGALPAIGKIIDPVNGALAAAENTKEDFNKNLALKGIEAPVEVWMEDRLVPHVRAQNDHDLYFTQGYIHAYFRLWQMDIQTRAAGGRVSEVAGPKAIEFDRGQRRKGMVFGAEKSLKAMEADPRTKAMLDAYRDGINTYVHTLNFRTLPIEYKLMGFVPEDWTNLRTALLLKYMADDLTGRTDDIQFTLLRDQLGQAQFDFLFPERIKGSKPVIPEGTKFDKPSLAQPKYPGDSVWAHFTQMQNAKGASNKPLNESASVAGYQSATAEDASGIGSNNWAISGSHTASGKPILCNDPHLALNLPCLWFEMQLTAPGVNSYGVSLPGAPGIIIGFNDKVSWGFTNNYRDVKDFYEIKSVSRTDYQFNGRSIPFEKSIEIIKVKGQPDVVDTVLYTIHGPVMYDASFPAPDLKARGDVREVGLKGIAPLLACTWMGHRGTNELLSVFLLNRAQNYEQFVAAIQHFECPAQNFVFADVAGNIAMWGQGQFINKWRGQGKYVMEGHDSLTLWDKDIPMMENPHVLNPPQGYVASANQQVTDSTYPYWYNGNFTEWRSWEINSEFLPAGIQIKAPGNFLIAYTGMEGTSPENGMNDVEMTRIQNSVYSKLWRLVDPYFKNYSKQEIKELLVDANFRSDDEDVTKFQIFWSQLYKGIWQDEFPKGITKYPSSEFTVQLLLSDSTSKYYDDRSTAKVETLRDIVQRAYKETTDSLGKLRASAPLPLREQSLEWYRVKNTSLTHLAKIPAFSYDHLKIGGWSNTINACTGNHGPSWRMIVEMDSIPKAYAIYPGGQSGNPGSKFYSDYIEKWVEGKYFTVHFLTSSTTKNPFKYTWTITP